MLCDKIALATKLLHLTAQLLCTEKELNCREP